MKTLFIILFSLFMIPAGAQMRASMGSDLMVARGLSDNQKFWTIGQTIRGEWKSDGIKVPVYAWVSYTGRGRYNNQLQAIAMDAATTPQTIDFTNRARLRHTQVSVGVKPYLKGSWESEEGWSMYGLGGLGILMGRVENSFNRNIDTSLYNVPVKSGLRRFNRMTLDLGLGFEWPMGGDLFIYTEGKTYIPLTNYPSNFLLNNNYSPLTVYLNFGARVLF